MKTHVPLVWILAGALLLAGVALRLAALGWLPLTPEESISALRAAELTPLGSAFWDPATTPASTAAPAYLHPTAALMGTMGARDSVARMIPALAGIGLLLLPLLLIRRMGWLRLLVALPLLAISPTLLTTSRTAGGEGLAALGIALAVSLMARSDRPGPMEGAGFGVGVGLGLLSGPSFWTGLLGLGVGFLLERVLSREEERHSALPVGVWLRRGAPAALLTFLVVGSWFGSRLGGLGDPLTAAGDWFTGWTVGGELPWITSGLLLPIYEPLLLVLGAVAIVLHFGGERGEWGAPIYWALGSLLAFLLYPARSPADLIWVVLPGIVAISAVIETLLERTGSLARPESVYLLTAVVLGLLTFAHLELEAADAGLGFSGIAQNQQVGYAALALLFALFLLLLFGFGWSWLETGLALGLSLTVALAAQTLAGSWRLNFDEGAARARELWRPHTNTTVVRLLEENLEALANAHVGRADGLSVDVHGEATPTLAWILRAQEPPSTGDRGSPSPVVLAPEGSDPPLAADYLGQAFALTERQGWSGALPPRFFSWWLDREAPTERERWVLYVRTDVAALGEELESEPAGPE